MTAKEIALWLLDDLCITHTGFLICNGTKESIIKAIDNYLANNEKTINDLD